LSTHLAQGLLLAGGAALNYRTRVLPVKFNESKLIARTTYALVVVAAVWMGIIVGLGHGLTPSARVIAHAAFALAGAYVALAILIVPKAVRVTHESLAALGGCGGTRSSAASSKPRMPGGGGGVSGGGARSSDVSGLSQFAVPGGADEVQVDAGAGAGSSATTDAAADSALSSPSFRRKATSRLGGGAKQESELARAWNKERERLRVEYDAHCRKFMTMQDQLEKLRLKTADIFTALIDAEGDYQLALAQGSDALLSGDESLSNSSGADDGDGHGTHGSHDSQGSDSAALPPTSALDASSPNVGSSVSHKRVDDAAAAGSLPPSVVLRHDDDAREHGTLPPTVPLQVAHVAAGAHAGSVGGLGDASQVELVDFQNASDE
jgi:hypothetical protein